LLEVFRVGPAFPCGPLFFLKLVKAQTEASDESSLSASTLSD